MLYYLKKYPISLTIIAVVIYLSFFKPPSLEVGKIVGIDKVAHLCMYAGILYDIPWWRLVRFPCEYLRCYSRYAVFLLRPPSLDNEEKDWYSLVYVFIHLLWDYRQDPAI